MNFIVVLIAKAYKQQADLMNSILLLLFQQQSKTYEVVWSHRFDTRRRTQRMAATSLFFFPIPTTIPVPCHVGMRGSSGWGVQYIWNIGMGDSMFTGMQDPNEWWNATFHKCTGMQHSTISGCKIPWRSECKISSEWGCKIQVSIGTQDFTASWTRNAIFQRVLTRNDIFQDVGMQDPFNLGLHPPARTWMQDPNQNCNARFHKCTGTHNSTISGCKIPWRSECRIPSGWGCKIRVSNGMQDSATSRTRNAIFQKVGMQDLFRIGMQYVMRTGMQDPKR